MKAKRFARLHSDFHKSVMLLLKMIIVEMDIGTEVDAFNGQEVNT